MKLTDNMTIEELFEEKEMFLSELGLKESEIELYRKC